MQTLKKGGLKIQVIGTWNAMSLEWILRTFYTTALFNIITWNAAYAMFPRSTFLKHETFPTMPLNDYFGGLHSKWTKRG